MNKQIFGYTPSQPAGDAYVKYCAVHENDDGDVVVQVRNERGIINEIVLPRSTGAELAAALPSPLRDAPFPDLAENQIKYMVDRFLGWQLPKNFNPDAGISYTRPNYHPSIDATPSGTNLFDAEQASDMVRYMSEGMPSPTETG